MTMVSDLCCWREAASKQCTGLGTQSLAPPSSLGLQPLTLIKTLPRPTHQVQVCGKTFYRRLGKLLRLCISDMGPSNQQLVTAASWNAIASERNFPERLRQEEDDIGRQLGPLSVEGGGGVGGGGGGVRPLLGRPRHPLCCCT